LVGFLFKDSKKSWKLRLGAEFLALLMHERLVPALSYSSSKFRSGSSSPGLFRQKRHLSGDITMIEKKIPSNQFLSGAKRTMKNIVEKQAEKRASIAF